jgi:hypothetical protein
VKEEPEDDWDLVAEAEIREANRSVAGKIGS